MLRISHENKEDELFLFRLKFIEKSPNYNRGWKIVARGEPGQVRLTPRRGMRRLDTEALLP